MTTYRKWMRGPVGRALSAALILTTFNVFVDSHNYLHAMEIARERDARIREIAKKMNVDPEFLLHPEGRRSFDFASLFRAAATNLGITEDVSMASASDAPLDVKAAIARTKSKYALVTADTTLTKLAGLVRLAHGTPASRGKKKGQLRGELSSLLRLIDRDLLPAVPDQLAAVASSRDRQMRSAIDDLRKQVKSVINKPHALDDDNVDATLTQLASSVGTSLALRNTAPRWTRDPLPLKDTYQVAKKRDANSGSGYKSLTPSTQAITTAAAPAHRIATNSVASEVTALASQLSTPAKIFTWVHDHIEFEAYSGVAKGALGTLKEGRGNDWDQALLVRDLLTARGYSSQLEWGRVVLPVAQAMNLVGTEDPMQAANLLATAGFDGIVNMNGSAPVSIEMTHAWVRAYIPYTLDRGASNGAADTWVRMDPSFKKYVYQPGISINGKVAWNEDAYLQNAVVRAPADAYSDQIWSYIRANGINCQNLAQVPKTGRIRTDNFPFVPATLTTPIVQLLGTAPDAPAAQLQSVAFTLRNANGSNVGNWSTGVADAWGRKLSITFAPATDADAQIIASYGGLYATPAYLVQLKPVFTVDDVQVATGTPVAAGAALDLTVAFHQPNVADDSVRHDVTAGETHVEVLDAGALPDSVVAARIDHLKTLLSTPGASQEAIASDKLALIGMRYMQHVDDGVAFSAGVRWQRAVKRIFEADVRQQLDVAYNVAGAAVRLQPGKQNIDVARLLVGIVPISADPSSRAQALALAGIQSSYLEASIWEEMRGEQGISAAKALLLARKAGQQLYTINGGNVDAVLSTISLPDDVESEIRGAVAQGRIAKVASVPVSVGHWSGTGYFLEDPQTGAASYPISGGTAGGDDTGDAISGIKELLGSESWLEGSPLGELLHQLMAMLGGGGNDSSNPSTTQSDPVNMSSGNMYRTFSDASIVARGIPVAVSRTYNSRSTMNGAFGYGWTYNYGEELIANGDGSVTYRESDGTEHLFANQNGTFVAPAGKYLTLMRSGAGYTMTSKDGTQFGFDANGRLTTQTDLNGNSVTINRDANGFPSTVVDASGRTVLTFTISAGRITKLTDLAGRATLYAYSGDDLTAVTDTNGKTSTFTYDLGHNMTALADPAGNTQSYDYDADDRMFHHVDAVGAEEYFHYDIASRQSVVTDRRGGDRLIVFDDLGRAVTEADPAGNVVHASFDAANNRTQSIDSRGFITTYEFDAAGNTTKETLPDGGVVSTSYDERSRPLTTTDALGTTTTNTYDGNGNLVQSTKSVNGVSETTTNVYDSYGRLTSTTDANNHTSSMTWNDNGSLATRTDAANQTTTMITDALGRITSMKDPGGNETKLVYDGRDRILSMIDPYQNSTSFTYDDAGRRTQVTNPRGTTVYAYDGEGRVLSVRDPLGHTTRTTYDVAGNVLTRADARGNTMRYEYDAIGRTTKMTDATGGVWQYDYCSGLGGGGGASCSSCGGGASGTFCDVTDPKGNHLHQEFDRMGRVVSMTDSLGHSAFTTYDKGGRKLVETDANGNATKWAYDEDGRLVNVTEASGAVTSYTYDRGGNKLTQKDANGHVWSYAYDALSRMISETDPLGHMTSYAYDALGNLKTKKDANGQTMTYVYDIRRLKEVDYPNGTKDSFTYDALGRRTGQANADVAITYTFDALNRVLTQTQTDNAFQRTKTISYAYDTAGNRTEITTELGTTRYTYDGKNRMSTVSDPNLGNWEFGYDAMDRRTSLTYPNGLTTSYAYDNAYRLTAIATKDHRGNVMDAWSYQYDAVGNRTSKTDMNGRTETYHYDSTYRLTQAAYGDGTSETFGYDAVGNRIRYTNETTSVSYTFNDANQLLFGSDSDSWTYDGNGNVKQRHDHRGGPDQHQFTYDYNNHLTSYSGSTFEVNRYAPDGQRIRVGGSNVSNQAVINDTAGNPVAMFDSQLQTYRVYGQGMDDILGEIEGRVAKRYFSRDALGSVTLVTLEDGTVDYRTQYKAFGAATSTGNNDRAGHYSMLGYTARENSVNGMMYFRARHYDTTTGRFVQRDTYRGGDVDPPSLHRYMYALDAPVDYIDPSGQFAEELMDVGSMMAAGLMLSAFGAAVAAAVEIAASAIVIVAIAAAAVAMIVFLVLYIIEVINEMGRVNDEVEARKIFAKSKEYQPITKIGQYRWKGPKSLDTCAFLASAILAEKPGTPRFAATIAVFIIQCIFGPWSGAGGDGDPPGPPNVPPMISGT